MAHYDYKDLTARLGDRDLAFKYVDYCQRQERKKRTGGTAFKDSDQSRVYRAERKARKAWRDIGIARVNFSGYAEARKKTESILKSKLWKDMAGHHVEIAEKKDMGHRSAVAGLAWKTKIQLCPTYGLNLDTLLHELAHSAGNHHHGLTFRKDHLRLVSRFIGRTAADILKKAYKEEGLKLIVRQKKLMTPEEWLAKYNKMAVMRLMQENK